MAGITTAFWEFTINNYTPTDIALLQQGYPDQIKQLVYSQEVGEEGTPHVQAYLRLPRQQRLSYVKKLFPRGHFRAITCEVYNLNAQRYPQKQDHTSDGPVIITNNQFPDPIAELMDVIDEAMGDDEFRSLKDLLDLVRQTEFLRVIEKPSRAKFYVSPLYTKVKATYFLEIKIAVVDRRNLRNYEAHTHTHTQAESSSDSSSITNEAPFREVLFSTDQGGEDYEECSGEEDESHSSGSGSSSSENGDCEEF